MNKAIVLAGSRGIGKGIADSIESMNNGLKWPKWEVIRTSTNDVDTSNLNTVKRFIDKNQGDLAYDHDDLPVFLARNPWHLQNASETWPDIRLLKTREQTGQ